VSYRYIIYEVRGRVAVVTLNRPEKLNAWVYQMGLELGDALQAANEDDGVGALVLAGAGRAFCAGADVIEEFKRRADAQDAGISVEDMEGNMASRFTVLRDLLLHGKPTIAAIHGYAIGIGLTLPLNCDIRIVAEGTKLNTMFLRVGLVPEFGSSYLLPRIIGLAKACELVYLPRMVDAQEALEIGLVNRVVPADRLMAEAMALAETLANGPTFALRKAKEALYRNLDATYVEAVARESKFFAECMSTAEHREGIRAFMERREPDFHRPEAADRAPE
jgi:2-(1,2-epoxy-1,2-dihydrophenyl)acetyl-CoA isomerase